MTIDRTLNSQQQGPGWFRRYDRQTNRPKSFDVKVSSAGLAFSMAAKPRGRATTPPSAPSSAWPRPPVQRVTGKPLSGSAR